MAELRAGVERLRALQPQGGHPEPGSEIPVILTSTGDDASVHAAAIDAGAAAFVRAVEITHTGILRSYMDRFNDARKSMILRRGARPQPITATFDLPDDDLRDGQTGRWDAKRIAPVLGVDLTDLVRAIEANYSTVARTPASEALQPKLAPFANVITMIRQAYASDGDDTGGQAAERARTRTDERLRMWLRRTQPALGDRSPLDALLEPGLAPAVEQWVTRIWLGEPG
ncbi:MAG TPA: antitoxin Xre/MbcA/ParS toxin-binding domain-containing protein [Gemmatimonadales bacterium]